MTFISNPLGGSTGLTSLGNLTEQYNALQQTEIQRKLREIEQNKQWKREDQKANQAFALQMASVPYQNDVRIGVAKKMGEMADNYLSDLTKMVSSSDKAGRGLSLEEKMKIMGRKQELMNFAADQKSFMDALSEVSKDYTKTREKLSPEQADIFDKQIADLHRKWNDPELSKTLSSSDVIEAYTPPEATANMIMGQWTQDLVPLVDEATNIDLSTGRKLVSDDKLKKAIRSQIATDRYGLETVMGSMGTKNPEDVVSTLADRLRASIEQTAGWRPSDKTASEKSGFVVESDSTDFSGRTGDAIVLTGKVQPFKIVDDKGMAATFEPIKIMNVLGRPVILGEKQVKANQVDTINDDQHSLLKMMDVKMAGENQRPDGKWEVTYKIDQTVPGILEYSAYKNRFGSIYSDIDNAVNMLTGASPERGKSGRGEPNFPEAEGSKTKPNLPKNKYGI